MAHTTHVITTLSGGVAQILQQVAGHLDEDKKFTLLVLKQTDLDQAILEEVSRNSANIIFLPLSILKSLFFIIKYIWSLDKKTSQKVLTYDFRSNLIGGIISYATKVDWFPSIHGLEAAFVTWRLWLLKFFISRATYLIVPSRAVASKIEECHLLSRDKIKVIYNGIDIIKFSTKIVEIKHTINMVCVGNFYLRLKGQHVAIKAMKLLPNHYTLTFIGGGAYCEEAKDLAKKNKLGNRIRFAGEMSNDDIATTLCDYDILIVPSLSEAFGLVAIEGLASGLPVIASDVGGLAEIVNDGCGILFEPGNYEELALCIATIGKDRDLWKRLHLGSRRRAQSFSMDEMVKNYKSLVFKN